MTKTEEQINDYCLIHHDSRSQKRILIIGDAIIDHYIEGSDVKISPEAPVPVIHGRVTEYRRPGGAANVLNNIIKMGGKGRLLSLGENPEDYMNLGFQDSYIRFLGDTLTPKKTRIICGGQHVCRLDREIVPVTLSLEESKEVVSKIEQEMLGYKPEAIVLSDYGKSGTTGSFYELLFDAIHAYVRKYEIKDLLVVIDSKNKFRIPPFSGFNVVVTPNEKEYMEYIAQNGSYRRGVHVIETRGARGLGYNFTTDLKRDSLHINPFKNREVKDTCGAGDVVTAVTALVFSTKDIERRLEFIQLTAEISVEHLGVYAVKDTDILQHIEEIFNEHYSASKERDRVPDNVES